MWCQQLYKLFLTLRWNLSSRCFRLCRWKMDRSLGYRVKRPRTIDPHTTPRVIVRGIHSKVILSRVYMTTAIGRPCYAFAYSYRRDTGNCIKRRSVGWRLCTGWQVGTSVRAQTTIRHSDNNYRRMRHKYEYGNRCSAAIELMCLPS